MSHWQVGHHIIGTGGRHWRWSMLWRDRVRVWFHRHFVADEETSRRLAEIDEQLDQANRQLNAAGRKVDEMRESLRRQDRAEEFGEQMEEVR